MGDLLSHKGEAYRYLAESIRGFPDPDTLVGMMGTAGLERGELPATEWGIVAIHKATK